MEKVTPSYRKKIDRAWLYADDVEHVVAIMKKVCKTVTIEVPGFNLNSASELPATKAAKFESMTITGATPRISLELRSIVGEVVASEDSPEGRGVVSEVVEYLSGCRPPPYVASRTLQWATLVVSTVLVMMSLVSPFYYLFTHPTTNRVLAGLLGVFSVSACVWIFGAVLRMSMWSAQNSTRIYTTLRKDDRGLWELYKDKVIPNLMTAAIVGPVTFILGFLVRGCTGTH